MSSPLTRDNGYQYPPEPAPAPFNREIANALHGDIHARIKAIEDKRLDLQSLIDDLTFFGIQRLDSAINPLIADVQAEITALQATVAQTLIDNAKIISDFQDVTAVNLDNLRDDIDEMQEQINVILSGNLPAANVVESTTRVFVSPAQRTLIGTLNTTVTGLSSARFNFRGTWSNTTAYVVGDVLISGTGLYRCILAHPATTLTPVENPTRWSTVVVPIEDKVPNLERLQRMARLTQFRSAI